MGRQHNSKKKNQSNTSEVNLREFSVSFLQVEYYTVVGQPTQGTHKPGKKNCAHVHWSLEEVPRGLWSGQSRERKLSNEAGMVEDTWKGNLLFFRGGE